MILKDFFMFIFSLFKKNVIIKIIIWLKFNNN